MSQIGADWCKLGGCRSLFGRGNGVACLEETSGLCGKQILPPQGTGSRVKPVMTQYVVWVYFVSLFGGCFQKTGSRVSHPRGAPTSRDDTEYSLVDLFRGNLSTISPFHLSTAVAKRLDPGSSHPTKPLRALARTPTGRDDAVYSLVGVVSGLCAVMWLQKTGSRVKPVMTQYLVGG